MKPHEKLNAHFETHGVALRVVSWPHKQQRITLSNGVLLEGDEVRRFKTRAMSPFLIHHMDHLYQLSDEERNAEISKIKASHTSAAVKHHIASMSRKERDQHTQNMLTARSKRVQIGPRPDAVPWNRGQTKETNAKLAEISAARTGTGNPFYGKTHTQESKEAASIRVQQAIETGKWTPHAHNSLSRWRYQYEGRQYRSSWEVMYHYLNPQDEYESLRIPYSYDGANHVYIVDFVNHVTKIVSEVKPSERTNDPKTRAKTEAATTWAENNGYQFRIVSQPYFAEFADALLESELELPKIAEKIKRITNEVNKPNRD